MDELTRLKERLAKQSLDDDPREVLQVIERVLELDPLAVGSRVKAGELWAQLGDVERAIDSYRRAAEFYAETGELLKAIALCKVILAMEPKHTSTQGLLANLYSQNKPRELEQLSEKEARRIARRRTILPKIPLFSDLPRPAFLRLVQKMLRVTALPGEIVIKEGEDGSAMFIVVSGCVKIRKNTDSGQEWVLGSVGAGDFFGEIALLGGERRIATATAVEQTQLLVLNKKLMASLTADFPIVEEILRRLSHQRLLSNLMLTSPFFSQISAAQRRALLACFKIKTIPAAKVLVQEGAATDGLYLLASGEALASIGHGQQRKAVGRIRAGDIFGEGAWLGDGRSPATIETQTVSTLLKIPQERVVLVARDYPQLTGYLAQTKQERQRTYDAVRLGKMRFGPNGLEIL